MAVYYLDTSALIKRYFAEKGTPWVRTLFAARNHLIIARITHVEVASALARRVREGTLSIADETKLLRLFGYHLTKRFAIIEIDAAICSRAAGLAKTGALRGYDSVQLACGSKADGMLHKIGGSLTFLSADKELLKAGLAEGLTTDNPENH